MRYLKFLILGLMFVTLSFSFTQTTHAQSWKDAYFHAIKDHKEPMFISDHYISLVDLTGSGSPELLMGADYRTINYMLEVFTFDNGKLELLSILGDGQGSGSNGYAENEHLYDIGGTPMNWPIYQLKNGNLLLADGDSSLIAARLGWYEIEVNIPELTSRERLYFSEYDEGEYRDPEYRIEGENTDRRQDYDKAYEALIDTTIKELDKETEKLAYFMYEEAFSDDKIIEFLNRFQSDVTMNPIINEQVTQPDSTPVSFGEDLGFDNILYQWDKTTREWFANQILYAEPLWEYGFHAKNNYYTVNEVPFFIDEGRSAPFLLDMKTPTESDRKALGDVNVTYKLEKDYLDAFLDAYLNINVDLNEYEENEYYTFLEHDGHYFFGSELGIGYLYVPIPFLEAVYQPKEDIYLIYFSSYYMADYLEDFNLNLLNAGSVYDHADPSSDRLEHHGYIMFQLLDDDAAHPIRLLETNNLDHSPDLSLLELSNENPSLENKPKSDSDEFATINEEPLKSTTENLEETTQPIKISLLILCIFIIISLPIYAYLKKSLTKENIPYYFLHTPSGNAVLVSSVVTVGVLLFYPDPIQTMSQPVNIDEEDETLTLETILLDEDIERLGAFTYSESGKPIDRDILETFLRLMSYEDSRYFLSIASEPTNIGPYRIQIVGDEIIFLNHIIQIDAPYQGAEIYINDSYIETIDETGHTYVEFLATGNDKLTIKYQDHVTGSIFEIEEIISDIDIQDANGDDLFFSTDNYSIEYINVSTDYNDAVLLVNDIDTGITFEAPEVFGPVLLDGSTHIRAKRMENGEEIFTDPQYLIKEKTHYFLSFGHEALLIEANSQELFEAVNQHVAEWMRSSIEHDDRYFTKLAPSYRAEYLERVNKNFNDQRESGYRYEGYVEKATFDQDSFKVYEHTDERIVAAIDVKFTFQSNYYTENQNQDTYPLTEAHSIWTYVLDYGVETEEWLILGQEELVNWNPSSPKDMYLN
ncbi:hypothetical protein J2T56_001439 [Natronobacillus azotifigens]|uniref:Uncharacterized protein n=1 Tax=Natronobacillus azotifigens TaxID=472978 RepID=A0A9J6RC57_9BACI|nr:hypothetical protein [Natronobacillus azotifigens]MCZ0703127.1 hypothetical protein [Natronobacillus azotifigens]